MKNILLLALLASATLVEAAPSFQGQDGQTPNAKEMKRKRKLAKKNGPQVYKGTIAEQSRVITDAPGSEKDDSGDGTGKNGKAANSKKQ